MVWLSFHPIFVNITSAVLFLYNLIVGLYYRLVQLASIWNPKAAAWVKGRKTVFTELEKKFPSTNKLIWVHCSSAGEFEQGKPVIEILKTNYPGHEVLVSFFSPSGFELASRYRFADHFTYLPLDTASNAQRFIELTQPSLAIFIKYEFWYHHIQAAAFRHIPVLLVSGVFRKEQVFFKGYGGFYRNILHLFRHLFVQDETSLHLLKQHGINHASIVGDTRFDRVLEIARKFEPIPPAEIFKDGQALIVAGSTWPEDEDLLSNPGCKLIITPHEINESHLIDIEKKYPAAVRFSNFRDSKSQELIIDNVGMLSRLYHYADICYVGGGFTRDGIHNILEAAVWGKPVVFGPNYKKYREAHELIAAGGAFSVNNKEEWEALLHRLLDNKKMAEDCGRKAAAYVAKYAGGSELLLQYIQEKRLLTN